MLIEQSYVCGCTVDFYFAFRRISFFDETFLGLLQRASGVVVFSTVKAVTLLVFVTEHHPLETKPVVKKFEVRWDLLTFLLGYST